MSRENSRLPCPSRAACFAAPHCRGQGASDGPNAAQEKRTTSVGCRSVVATAEGAPPRHVHTLRNGQVARTKRERERERARNSTLRPCGRRERGFLLAASIQRLVTLLLLAVGVAHSVFFWPCLHEVLSHAPHLFERNSGQAFGTRSQASPLRSREAAGLSSQGNHHCISPSSAPLEHRRIGTAIDHWTGSQTPHAGCGSGHHPSCGPDHDWGFCVARRSGPFLPLSLFPLGRQV